jgi:P27 family predicted phage terminase small subunit
LPAEPKPPDHLSRLSKAFWRQITAKYALETEHLAVLRRALEASDRADEAGELLRRDGLTTTDRYGQTKPHPAVTIELQNRAAFLRFLVALKLGEDEQQSATIPARELVRKRWRQA